MCGIAGIYHFDRERRVAPELLRSMCDAIRHRGPDDAGYCIQGNFGMGMRRLSIIDLDGGRQPIRNEDGSVWMVFNGEIYNFPELRRDLIRTGGRKSATPLETGPAANDRADRQSPQDRGSTRTRRVRMPRTTADGLRRRS